VASQLRSAGPLLRLVGFTLAAGGGLSTWPSRPTWPTSALWREASWGTYTPISAGALDLRHHQRHPVAVPAQRHPINVAQGGFSLAGGGTYATPLTLARSLSPAVGSARALAAAATLGATSQPAARAQHHVEARRRPSHTLGECRGSHNVCV
jgi:hypothetical protein